MSTAISPQESSPAHIDAAAPIPTKMKASLFVRLPEVSLSPEEARIRDEVLADLGSTAVDPEAKLFYYDFDEVDNVEDLEVKF